MQFNNTYASLPERFYQRVAPTPVRDPKLLLFNRSLAEQLGVGASWLDEPSALAAVLAGNETPPGAEPLAMAYAGHQFGNFVPQLGDGRAHLLGELVDARGEIHDLQLKGSGPTAFSRGGDGRCALGPALREFIMSEAMHALGVPTTRALAVVTTGEPVIRETLLPGAVVTRVARSHMRVGTFQYFAVREDDDAVRTLADYAIDRLYPALREREDRYLGLLEQVIEAQIRLVTEWMRVGFIHGVMNTDNTSIAGETIDFGPCAMMGVYDPATVFSSIDHRGRYAYGNQPAIIAWNMARFAETLLPLLADDREAALKRAQDCISSVAPKLDEAWQTMFARKLGLRTLDDNARQLVTAFAQRMRDRRLDHTITFDQLTRFVGSNEADPELQAQALPSWFDDWQKALDAQGLDREEIAADMRRHNPVVIPRNHHVEAVLERTSETLDPAPVEAFLEVLCRPYEMLESTPRYQDAPSDEDRNYVTFCGT